MSETTQLLQAPSQVETYGIVVMVFIETLPQRKDLVLYHVLSKDLPRLVYYLQSIVDVQGVSVDSVSR